MFYIFTENEKFTTNDQNKKEKHNIIRTSSFSVFVRNIYLMNCNPFMWEQNCFLKLNKAALRKDQLESSLSEASSSKKECIISLNLF